MLILAFDTSGTSGSVALLDKSKVILEAELDPTRKSAQTLAPAIGRLLGAAQVQPQEIRLVATTIGPGSFTGLRIGVTAAKIFAYAVGADVIGLSTLEVLAAAVPALLLTMQREVEAVLDAQRGELFVGRFRLSPVATGQDALPRIERLAEDQLINAERWVGGLQTGSIATGSGLRRLSAPPPGVEFVDAANWEPRAAVIGRLAWHYYQTSRRDDLWKLAPVYLRPSYAEEKVSQKRKTAGTKPGPGGA